MSATRISRKRVLILWNQVEEDVYEAMGQQTLPLPWDVSRTAAQVRSVREEMDELVAAVHACGYETICVNTLDDIEILMGALRLHKPDVVLNLVEHFHDDQGQESSVVGVYELFGIAYTGSSGYALSLCQRKHHTKRLLQALDLPTPWYFVVENLDDSIPDADTLDEHYPLIVKPAREDASGGIEGDAVVMGYPALLQRVHQVLAEFGGPVLVEEYIDGREIHVAIMGNEEPTILPLFEMLFDDSEFNPDDEWRPRIISFDGKWDPLSKDFYTLLPTCPAPDMDAETELLLGILALRAYRATGCRDYARVDMRIDDAGVPYILEVNPNPDLTDGSAFMMCATASGRSYARTLGEIIEMAYQRRVAASSSRPTDDERDAPTDRLNRKYWRDF